MEVTYEEFIQNILDNRGRFACGDEYHERHHIIPKCMGGTNNKDNLIDLYAREHFEAHRLLALENPENEKLIYAWRMMTVVKDKSQERYIVTAEEYEEAKIAFSKIQSEVMKIAWKDAEKKKRHSELMKEKYSNPENNPMYGRRGEDNPLYGKHRSEETIEKIRKTAQERCKNPEYLEKVSKTQKERYQNPENNPMFGKHHTDETKRKIGDANRGHVPSEEARNKASQSMKKKWKDNYYREEQSKRMKELNSRPEYKQKQIESHRGDKSWSALAVFNVETKNVYGAATLAKDDTGIDNSMILKCCKGIIETAGGYMWKYVYDYTRKDGVVIPGAITLGIITEDEVFKQLNKQQND